MSKKIMRTSQTQAYNTNKVHKYAIVSDRLTCSTQIH